MSSWSFHRYDNEIIFLSFYFSMLKYHFYFESKPNWRLKRNFLLVKKVLQYKETGYDFCLYIWKVTILNYTYRG